MMEKSRDSTTIEVSMETYEKLHSLQTEIQRIMKHKVGFDRIIRILLAVNPTDELIDVYLGERIIT